MTRNYEDCRVCPEIQAAKEENQRRFDEMSVELKETLRSLNDLLVTSTKNTAEITERLKAGNERFEKIEQALERLAEHVSAISTSTEKAHVRIDGLKQSIMWGVVLVNGTMWILLTAISYFLNR